MGSGEPFPCNEPLSFMGASGVLEALDNGIMSLLFKMVSHGVAFLKKGTDLTCLCNLFLNVKVTSLPFINTQMACTHVENQGKRETDFKGNNHPNEIT